MSSDNIIECEVTPEIFLKAREKAVAMGNLKNSITRGGGNLAGFIGELLVLEYLKGEELDNTYDYDIIYEGIKIDVKTKRTSVKPLEHYECSIAKLNTKQKCDVYVFTRVKNDYSVGWILGFMDKEEYFKKATFLKKGTTDPSNGWKVKSDCYNLPISDLEKLSEDSIRHRSKRTTTNEGVVHSSEGC